MRNTKLNKMLDTLAIKHETDKSSIYHNYCGIYESYLAPYQHSNIALIELGVGGYDYVDRGGQSLRMWYEYFTNGKLVGIDIYEKHGIMNDRTDFFQGSQTDKHLLKTIINRELDKQQRFVIDDASHNNKLTIETFKIIFPLLKSGDIYFVEDVHTSYWQNAEYEGKEKPGAKGTTMQYFSELTHQLNYEALKSEYRNEFALQIEFIHFYKEMIVIKKK